MTEFSLMIQLLRDAEIISEDEAKRCYAILNQKIDAEIEAMRDHFFKKRTRYHAQPLWKRILPYAYWKDYK